MATRFRPSAGVASHQEMQVMSTYWTNFARTGDPNGPGLPDRPRFTPANPVRLVFGEPNRPGPISGQGRARLDALDAYYPWERDHGRGDAGMK